MVRPPHWELAMTSPDNRAAQFNTASILNSSRAGTTKDTKISGETNGRGQAEGMVQRD